MNNFVNPLTKSVTGFETNFKILSYNFIFTGHSVSQNPLHFGVILASQNVPPDLYKIYRSTIQPIPSILLPLTAAVRHLSRATSPHTHAVQVCMVLYDHADRSQMHSRIQPEESANHVFHHNDPALLNPFYRTPDCTAKSKQSTFKCLRLPTPRRCLPPR